MVQSSLDSVAMVEYIKQDVSAISHGVVAHGVNCLGVMGSGVAKALRDKYPQIFTRYKNLCDFHRDDPTSLLGLAEEVVVNNTVGHELVIVNCFTQHEFGRDGKRYADAQAVGASVDQAVELAKLLGLPFYMPKIGCGLGGLIWDREIEPIVFAISEKHNYDIFVCDL